MASVQAGSVALVTGGGSGIGRALAMALSERGVKVAVSDLNLDDAQACAHEIATHGGSALAVRLDVTSSGEWDLAKTVIEQRLGPVDLLCSNAGSTGRQSPMVDMPLDYMRWLFEVNVFGAVLAIQKIVPGMQARGHGHVLITASAASFGATPMFGDYSASKHAVFAVADTLRLELEGSGVGVSVLCPSGVQTNIAANTRRNIGKTLSVAQEGSDSGASAAAVAASGGFLTAERVAEVALRGIDERRFIIPTHRLSGARAKERFDELQAGLETLAD